MSSSRYTQLHPDILVEYIYTDLNNPEQYGVKDTKVEILKDQYVDKNYLFLEDTWDADTNGVNSNIRDNSAVPINGSNSIYAYLDTDGPIAYNNYDDNLTDTQDLVIFNEAGDPNHTVEYDTIRFHFTSNFDFENYDGYILGVLLTQADGSKVNLASLVYNRTDNYNILNPVPFLLGNRMYTSYIQIKVPAAQFLLAEANKAFTDLLTDNKRISLTSTIDIELYGIQKTEIQNNFRYFSVSKINEVLISKQDQYDKLAAYIKESATGDYYELYGAYNGKIFEDYITGLNAVDNQYAVFHEISVKEVLYNETIVETAYLSFIQSTNWGEPIKYRPVLEHSDNAVSYSINYTLRLYNKLDNSQIIKTSQIVSFKPKKYGKSLAKINLGTIPTIAKVYNKVVDNGLTNLNINNIGNANTTNIIKTEYVNVYRDRYDIVIGTTQVSGNNTLDLTALTNNNIIYEQGDASLGISPFDDYILFNISRRINDDILPVDLTQVGNIYLSFTDNTNSVKIQNYTNTNDIELNNGQVLFKITKDQSQQILSLNNNAFYITSKFEDENGASDETVLYTGKFYEGSVKPDVTLQQNYNKLKDLYTEDVNILKGTNNTLNNEIDTVNANISVLNKSVKDYKNLTIELQDTLEAAILLLSDENKKKYTEILDTLSTRRLDTENNIRTIFNSLNSDENNSTLKELENNVKAYSIDVDNMVSNNNTISQV